MSQALITRSLNLGTLIVNGFLLVQFSASPESG